MATLTPTEIFEPKAVKWIKRVTGEEINTVSELMSSSKWRLVEEAVDAGIERANNKAVSNVARIKKWTVLKKDFSITGGELSPTLKLKRFHVAKMYKDIIEEMYKKQ